MRQASVHENYNFKYTCLPTTDISKASSADRQQLQLLPQCWKQKQWPRGVEERMPMELHSDEPSNFHLLEMVTVAYQLQVE